MLKPISLNVRARLMLLVMAIGVVTAVGSLVTGLGTAGAATSVTARNGMIFYDVGSGARGSAIFAVNPNRSRSHRVAGRAWEPSVSADGRLVAFLDVRSEGLAIMNADGSHRHSVRYSSGPFSVESPALSPDGEQIVFIGNGGGLWEVNTDGSKIQELASLHNGATSPVFSPTGKTILFTEYSKRTGRFLGLFLVNSDGTKVRAVPNGRRASDGSFSPNGKLLVFEGPHNSIYRMRLDGSKLRRLTHPPKTGKGGGPAPFDQMPKFSPDGTQIVFKRSAGNLPGGGWSGPHGLFIMNANGSHLHLLTSNPDAEHPFWSSHR